MVKSNDFSTVNSILSGCCSVPRNVSFDMLHTYYLTTVSVYYLFLLPNDIYF